MKKLLVIGLLLFSLAMLFKLTRPKSQILPPTNIRAIVH